MESGRRNGGAPRREAPRQPGTRAHYEPPRVVSDEAFEQISLACSTKHGTKKNFT